MSNIDPQARLSRPTRWPRGRTLWPVCRGILFGVLSGLVALSQDGCSPEAPLLALPTAAAVPAALAGMSPEERRAAGAILPPSAQKKEYEIPFTYDRTTTPSLIVMAHIDGSEPMPFLVDTGFGGGLLLYRWAADRSGLVVSGSAGQGRPGSIPLSEASVRTARLVGTDAANSLALRMDRAAVAEAEPSPDDFGGIRVAGVIGAGLLARTTARFDFVRKVLTLRLPVSPDDKAGREAVPLEAGAVRVPLRRSPDGYYAKVVVPTQNGGAAGAEYSADLIVDMDSNFTALPAALLDRIQPAPTVTGQYRSFDGVLHLVNRVLLRKLSIGECTESDVAVSGVLPADRPHLGLDVLARYRVTLDFAGGAMVLEPATDHRERRRPNGWTGILMDRQKAGEYGVAVVEPGSAASEAGVRPGDLIIAVDGRPLRALPPAAAKALLNGLEEATAVLTLERGGRALTLSCGRRSEFAPSGGYPSLGATVDWAGAVGGRMTVAGVNAGGAAERAGLRVGDEIASLNGHPVGGLTPDSLGRELFHPEVALTVRRGAGAPAITVTIKGVLGDAGQKKR